MNKKILGYATILLGGIMLAGCGNSSSTNSTSSSSSSTTQSSTQKKSSSTKQSSSSLEQSASSSSNSSAKASSTAKTTKVDDKTAGVMLMLLVDPTWLKDSIEANCLYYSPGTEDRNSEATVGYSFFTNNGDPVNYLYYKVDGNTITYKRWTSVGADSVADGHFIVETVSLSRLENDYYISQGQKDEVNGYVSQLKNESDYSNQNE